MSTKLKKKCNNISYPYLLILDQDVVVIKEVPNECLEAQKNEVFQNDLNITIESTNLNNIECQYLEGKRNWVWSIQLKITCFIKIF